MFVFNNSSMTQMALYRILKGEKKPNNKHKTGLTLVGDLVYSLTFLFPNFT